MALNLETLGVAVGAALCAPGYAFAERPGPGLRSRTDADTTVGGRCGRFEVAGGAKEGESTIIEGICAPVSAVRNQGLSVGTGAADTGGSFALVVAMEDDVVDDVGGARSFTLLAVEDAVG